jgi:hypothetical protein
MSQRAPSIAGECFLGSNNIYQLQITIAKTVRTVDRNLQLAIMNKYRPETHYKIMKEKLAI